MVIDLSPFYGNLTNIDKLFENFWNPYPISQRRMPYPPLNVSEDDAKITVRCEIPGMEVDDIDLTITDSSLLIKGERKTGKGKYYRQERPAGMFQRIVNINASIDRNAIKATMRDGLLEIVLPKSDDSKPKKITVEA